MKNKNSELQLNYYSLVVKNEHKSQNDHKQINL